MKFYTSKSILLYALLLANVQSFAQTFTTSNQPFLDGTGYVRGISWADVDNDGDQDVYTSGTGAYNGSGFDPLHSLYINDGSGNFTLSTQLQSTSTSGSNSFGDLNNDGNLDLLLAKTATSITELYMGDGTGNFTIDQSTTMSSGAGTYEGSVCWGDYDNDGFLDMYMVRWSNSSNRLHRNNGDGTFTQITTGAPVTDNGWSSLGIWGDIDNDNDLDLFVGNYQEPNKIYINDGSGNFTTLAGAGTILTDNQNTRDANWIDYNNDGFFDIYVANQSSTDRLYRNNGDNTFTDVTSLGNFNSGSSWSSNWGDFDNDGDLDLMSIGLSGSNDSRFMRNDGTGFTAINPSGILPTSFSGSHSTTALFTDANNDGWLDAHILYPGNGAADLFFLNDGSDCMNWIEIDLQGTASNARGIGARIGVLATINGTPTWQYRMIDSQSAKAGHNMLRAHFGLAHAAVIDEITVSWSSGATCSISNVGVNQIAKISESACIAATTAGPFIDCATVLPVTFLDFTATQVEKEAELIWTIGSEHKNAYYTIERSSNMKTWTTIATIESNGATSSMQAYSTFDTSPLNGMNYYRLSQTDFDGSSEFLNVQSLHFSEVGKANIIRTVNVLGQTVGENYRGIVYDIYSNGTSESRFQD